MVVTSGSIARDATASDEAPIVIAAKAGQLLGIVTTPTVAPRGMAAVLLRGAGWRPSSGPRRTQVRLARRLAASGLHAVRFSYHGVAESSGQSEEIVRLDQPYTDDVDAIVQWVESRGLRPVLIGNCFGARTALSYAAHHDSVAGVALIVPPVHDFEVARRFDRRPLGKLARRVTPARAWAVLRSPRRRRAMGRTIQGLSALGRNQVRSGRTGDPVWLSRSFCRELGTVAGRGVPVLVVYGEDDNYGRDFELARAGSLGDVVDQSEELVTRRLVPGRIHGLPTVETQDRMLQTVGDWVVSTFLLGAPPRAQS